MSAIPYILVPLEITDGMLTSSTINEPDTGETAWTSGASYIAGDIYIRTETHRKYMALSDHSGVSIAPEDDPTRWKDIGATNRWAMFDTRRTTQSTGDTEITVVLQPGFFNACAFYMSEGATLAVTVKDEPDGSVIFDDTRPLDGPYIDEYDWCWGPAREQTKHIFSGILPYPDAELTVTVSASEGTPVALGMACIGDLRPLVLGDWGGTKYGAKVTPKSNSYISTDDFGDTTIVKRASATDMDIDIILQREHADYALASIQDVLDVPAAVIAVDEDGYAGLNIFGLISGPVSYESPTHATISANVKGLY